MDEVVSGEAVVIDVPVARFPSRMVAIVIDLLVQLAALSILNLAIGLSAGLDAASEAAVVLTTSIAVIVGYPVIFETLSRGKSLGKLAMGLRVVSDDGGPERFRQSLVRALAGVVEIWMLFGSPALITSLLSAKGKRLGDLFAGTFVIQERLPKGRYQGTSISLMSPMPPQLARWASTLELSALPDPLANAARDYLGRYRELTPQARYQLGERLAADVAARVSPPPPPGTPAPDFLSAVLAERRARQLGARDASC
ncbi:MAG TPA: RDD family protein [Streptosporangiaceae bacterium]|jgi:uncharacterized RDD family membrane protein YckC